MQMKVTTQVIKHWISLPNCNCVAGAAATLYGWFWWILFLQFSSQGSVCFVCLFHWHCNCKPFPFFQFSPALWPCDFQETLFKRKHPVNCAEHYCIFLSVIAEWSGHRENSWLQYLFQILNMTGNISATTYLCQLHNIKNIFFIVLRSVSALYFPVCHGLVYTFCLVFIKTHFN